MSTILLPTREEFLKAAERATDILNAAEAPALLANAVGTDEVCMIDLAQTFREDFADCWRDLGMNDETFLVCSISHAFLLGVLTGRELYS